MSQKEITFQSQGLTLRGVFHRSSLKKPVGNVLLIHGIINDKDEDGNFVNLAEMLSEKGYNVLRFDFRGHGDSDGKSEDVTIAGELNDLENAIKEFDGLISDKPKYIIIASSFGAVSSILYAAAHQDRIAKIVLWNPVLDFEKTFLKALTPWGQTFFNKKGYEELQQHGYITVPQTDFRFGKQLIREFKEIKPFEKLKKLRMPILTIHGTEDTSVPYSVSEKYGKPNSLSKFVSHKSDHSFVGIENIVIKETVEWVTENGNGKNANKA